MNKVKGTLYGLLWFILIVSLFSPFFLISNTYVSLIEISKYSGINGFYTLNLLPFLLFAVALFLNVLKPLNYRFQFANFLLTISGVVLLFFEKHFVISALSINEKAINLAVTPILDICVFSIYALYVSSRLFDNRKIGIRDIVEIAIFVSFAIILDLSIFKIKIGANGGSISFAMVPLFVICLRKGFFKGFFATGIVYGLVNCLLDGYGLIYYPFDYLLAFGSIALVALFRKQILSDKSKFLSYVFLIVGILVALVGRTMAATLSGMIYYHLGFGASLVYQLTYIGPSGGIVIILLVILLPAIKKLDKKFRNKY